MALKRCLPNPSKNTMLFNEKYKNRRVLRIGLSILCLLGTPFVAPDIDSRRQPAQRFRGRKEHLFPILIEFQGVTLIADDLLLLSFSLFRQIIFPPFFWHVREFYWFIKLFSDTICGCTYRATAASHFYHLKQVLSLLLFFTFCHYFQGPSVLASFLLRYCFCADWWLLSMIANLRGVLSRRRAS